MKISVDLVANTGSFITDFGRARKAAAKEMKELQQTAANAGKIIGASFVAAATGLAVFVQSQAKAIAEYQDIAEKIGDTAEAVASLKNAADVSETSFDQVAAASIKLTAALSKTYDESKGVGAALKAIGLEMEAFKKLSPVDQIDSISRALAGFEDGASKTAVAVALFGKSGAELLPFLNDLATGARRNITLTQQQIDAANEFQETLAGLKGNIGTLSQQFASELIPVALDVVQVFADLLRQVKLVAGDNSIKEFAQGAVLAFATVGESVFGLIKLLNAIRGSFQSVIADVRLLERLSPIGAAKGMFDGSTIQQALEERNRVAEEANQRYIDLWNYNGTAVTDALRKSFDSQKDYVNKARALVDEVTGFLPKAQDAGGLIPFRPGMEPTGKPRIKFDPPIPNDTARNAKEAADAMKDYAFEVAKAVDAEDTERRTAAQEAMNRQIAEARSVFESTRTPLENFNAEIVRLNKLRDTFVDGKPLIDADTYARAVAQAQDSLDSLGKKTEETTDKMSVFAEQAARNMQDAFADFLFDPFSNGLDGMLSDFANILQRMAAEAAAAKIFEALGFGGPGTGSGGGGFDWGSLFGSIGAGVSSLFGGFGMSSSGTYSAANIPGRAIGGPVTAGRAYMVGERGPEPFIPDSSGFILPNHAMAARGGDTYNITVPVIAPNGTVDRATIQQIGASAERGARRASARNN